MLLLHGLVHDPFGHGIIIPLIQNVDDNKTVSDIESTVTWRNWRCIKSCRISKLFESVLMNVFTVPVI